METTNLLAALKATEQAFFAELQNCTEEQVKQKLDEKTWSLLECAEHIFIVEVGLVRMLRAEAAPTAPEGTASTINREKLDKILQNRQTPIPAPDTVAPKGRFATLADLLKAFQKTRNEMYQLIEASNLVDGVLVKHPMLGDMTKADWVYFIPRHTARHIEQLKEIKQKIE